MKTLKLISIVTLVILSACNKEPQEGDKNSYTWQGRIFKGYSDEPLANTDVYLEAGKTTVLNNTEYKIVGETTTDASSYFSMTYKRLPIGFSSVGLYINSEDYNNFPIYTDQSSKSINRDFATYDHLRIHLTVSELNSLNDTLFLLPYSLLESDGGVRLNEELQEASAGKYLRITNTDKAMGLYLKCGVGGRVASTGLAVWTLVYGMGKKDFLNALNTAHIDSVPDYYNSLKFQLNGFPETDTIDLDL